MLNIFKIPFKFKKIMKLKIKMILIKKMNNNNNY